MAEPAPDIVLTRSPLSPQEVRRLVDLYFGDMLKYVVDVRRELVAVGGEMHADAEQVLLEDGSLQGDLWGANYFPDRPPDTCIEYTSLINIRPSADNRSLEIQDPAIRLRVRSLTFALIGRGTGD